MTAAAAIQMPVFAFIRSVVGPDAFAAQNQFCEFPGHTTATADPGDEIGAPYHRGMSVRHADAETDVIEQHQIRQVVADMGGPIRAELKFPTQGLQRLEKIMDEYVGGISTGYMTNEPLLTRGLDLLATLREDLEHIGAEDLHQLQRAWELKHRLLASESVTQHTLFRKETRWPGYYYRGDHMKLDDNDWHCFTLSRFDRNTGEWELEKAPVYHIVD